MGSWDERFRSESAYLRLFRDVRCVNNNTFPLFSQAVLYIMIHFYIILMVYRSYQAN